jgi:hypothetical protein
MNHSRIRPLPPGKRIPPFLPVPLVARHDGWSPVRQGDFIGVLAETGSVTRAAAAVGMSRASAYKLRAAPGAESFAAAWDAACGNEPPPRKLTFAELQQWAFAGPIVIHLRAGRYVFHTRKPNGTALLRVLAAYDRARFGREGPAW